MTAPVPAIQTFSDGQRSNLTPLNALGFNLSNLYNYTQGGVRTSKPLCVVYRQLAQQYPPNGVDSLVYWDVVYANTDYMFATSTSTQMTVRTAGWYRVSLQVHFDATPNGARGCKIMVNGTSPSGNSVASDGRNPVTSAEGTTLFCTCLVALSVGNPIYANIYQSSGGDSPLITAFSASFMSAEWISPL